MSQVQLFLSTVSEEFRSYRDALRSRLQRPNVTVQRPAHGWDQSHD
jgi:hypothetical protein